VLEVPVNVEVWPLSRQDSPGSGSEPERSILIVLWRVRQQLSDLALPRDTEVRLQREASLAVRTSDRWDQGCEYPPDDGLPHGGQARRRRQTGKARRRFSLQSLRLVQAQVARVGVSKERDQPVPMQTGPGPALEVIEAA
jgi:hypothetical protein